MSAHNDLLPGATNAVRVCMGVRETDKVLIITDMVTEDIGRALEAAARFTGATVEVILLEDLGQRPITAVPQELWDFLDSYKPSVTFYAASSQKGEIQFRIPLLETLREKYAVRHGHMIGVTPLIMQTGMLADYQSVARRSGQIYELVKNAREIKATSPSGTDLVARFDVEQLRWVNWDGIYTRQGIWGNLPEGEVFTSPAFVEGTLSPIVLGDFFSEKYGLLKTPLMIKVVDSHLVSCEHENSTLADDFSSYLQSHENGTRIGEFAIGTNEFLKEFIGNLLQDEKYPGLHVAFGNPYCNYTGAKWDSPIHVDVVMDKISLWVDGIQIMEAGKFTV